MMNQYVCRCCLKENPELSYKIFDTTTTLWNELQECSPASIKYERNDGLPQIICDLCWIRVQEANDFRKQCLQADQELRSRYAEYKNKAVEEVLGLVEKLRQQDTNTNFKTIAYDNVENNQDLPDFTELRQPDNTNLNIIVYHNLENNQYFADFTDLDMSLRLDKVISEQDLYNTSPDSGINEEGLSSEASSYFENSLQYEDESNVASPLQSQTPSAPNPPEQESEKSYFQCPHCDKKLTRNFQLKQHLMSIHNIGEGLKYTCKICNNNFASHHSLSYHTKSVHSQEKSFACTKCDKQFITKTQLNSHMRMHTGESKPRIFECKVCNKKWPTKSDLRTHMRTHDPNVERPFKCDECEKSFFTRGHLSSHRFVHTGEKPYPCEFCNRSYQSISNLNNHQMRRHIKEMMKGKNCDEPESIYKELKHKIEDDGTVLMEL